MPAKDTVLTRNFLNLQLTRTKKGENDMKIEINYPKDTGVDWSYYDKFTELNDRYLPDRGEGDTMATQAVTAVNKLVYKWYNDGDVYDTTHQMNGWFNDISSFANWLHKYLGGWIAHALETIEDCDSDEYYEEILQEVADTVLDERYLSWLNEQVKLGSVYKCDGPFKYVEHYDDEDEEDEY